MKRFFFSSRVALLTLALAILTIGPVISTLSDTGPEHRVSSNSYGVSGGNVNDRSSRFCCSGTLGALVQDTGGVQYILSNNHVLARSDQAAIGEDISQPGMIDLGCGVNEVVADLSAYPALSSNVDAAVAQLRLGAMSPLGEILDIGLISSNPLAATVGLGVRKSGRTTGHTTGSVSSVNASINVQYQRGCGGGKKFTVSFTNQVVVSGSGFSAGGDSGSLIVSTGSCPRPVALLYAGSSSSTIGNPIGEVLTKVGQAFNPDKTINFVGTTCTQAVERTITDDNAPTEAAIEFATASMRPREKNLMSRPGVIGVGVGALDENSMEAAIIVYVDRDADVKPKVPRRINGVRVKVIETDAFVAY